MEDKITRSPALRMHDYFGDGFFPTVISYHSSDTASSRVNANNNAALFGGYQPERGGKSMTAIS